MGLLLLAVFLVTWKYALSDPDDSPQYVLFTSQPSEQTVECLSQKDVEFYITSSKDEDNLANINSDENWIYIKQEDSQKVKDCR